MSFIAVNQSEGGPLHRSEIYIIPFRCSPTGNEAGFISKKVSKWYRNPWRALEVPSNISTSETFMSLATGILSEEGFGVFPAFGGAGTSSSSSLDSDSLSLFFKLEL